MAGNAGIIQAEIAIQIGTALAQLKEISDALQKVGAGAGAGFAPANQAVEGLGKTFRDFKKEQVQEGRLVGFYVQELTSFAGVSKETQGAVGGLVQGLTGLATAAGPLAVAWGAFEIVKAAAGWFKEAGEAAEKESQRLITKALEMQSAVDGLNRALSASGGFRSIGGLDQLSASAEKYRELLTLKRNAESWDVEAAAGGPEAQQAANTARTQREAFQKLGGMEEMYRLSVEMAKENALSVNAAEKEGLDKSVAAWRTAGEKRVADEKERTKEILRLRAEAARSQGLTDALLGDEFAPGTDLKKPAAKVAEEAAKHAAEAKAKQEKSWGKVAGPGNNEGEMEFAKDSARAAGDVSMAWQEAGNSVAGAFMSIGNAVGGSAGKMLQILGQMLASAIAVAIAYAAMAPPPWGAISMAAMAAGLLATIASAAMTPAPAGRQMGGKVVPGTYLVGEAGPELLNIPQGVSGNVIPNHRLAMAGASYDGPSSGIGTTLNVATFDSRSFEQYLTRKDTVLHRVLRRGARAGRS